MTGCQDFGGARNLSRHRHVGGLLGLLDLEADHRAAVQRREAAPLGGAAGDARDIGQPHLATAGGRDRQFAQRLHRLRRAEHAHRLLAAADLGAAAGHVDARAAQRIVDLRCGQAERRHPAGIERDVDLARHAADHIDLRDALARDQLARDRVLDEPAQFDIGHACRSRPRRSPPAPSRHRSAARSARRCRAAGCRGCGRSPSAPRRSTSADPRRSRTRPWSRKCPASPSTARGRRRRRSKPPPRPRA